MSSAKATTIYMPHELHSWLKLQAALEKTTISVVVSRALLDYRRQAERWATVTAEIETTSQAMVTQAAERTIQ